jgi:hypothetical protein
MKTGSVLLPGALAAASLLAVCLPPAWAYIKVEPLPLGALCRQSAHISVLRVEKVSPEKGVILFKVVEQLKGDPDGTVAKHVIGPNVNGAEVILDWAAEGKTAVLFCNTERSGKSGQEGLYGRGHVCIDGYWYWLTYDGSGWVAGAGEPNWLTRFCGTADKLRDALAKILQGEEVVVPGMAGDDKEALEQRRGKVQDLRASLEIVEPGAHSNVDGAKLPGKSDGKKPEAGEKQPDGKKPDDRKPDLVGTVKVLSEDGKSFTLLRPPNEKSKEPTPTDVRITERTTITTEQEAGKLAVGQTVSVWFGKGGDNVAAEIWIGKLPEPPEKKPAPDDKKPEPRGKKPGEKKPETGDKKPDAKKEK